MPATTLFGCKLRQLSTDCTLFYFMVALVQVIFLFIYWIGIVAFARPQTCKPGTQSAPQQWAVTFTLLALFLTQAAITCGAFLVTFRGTPLEPSKRRWVTILTYLYLASVPINIGLLAWGAWVVEAGDGTCWSSGNKSMPATIVFGAIGVLVGQIVGVLVTWNQLSDVEAGVVWHALTRTGTSNLVHLIRSHKQEHRGPPAALEEMATQLQRLMVSIDGEKTDAAAGLVCAKLLQDEAAAAAGAGVQRQEEQGDSRAPAAAAPAAAAAGGDGKGDLSLRSSQLLAWAEEVCRAAAAACPAAAGRPAGAADVQQALQWALFATAAYGARQHMWRRGKQGSCATQRQLSRLAAAARAEGAQPLAGWGGLAAAAAASGLGARAPSKAEHRDFAAARELLGAGCQIVSFSSGHKKRGLLPHLLALNREKQAVVLGIAGDWQRPPPVPVVEPAPTEWLPGSNGTSAAAAEAGQQKLSATADGNGGVACSKEQAVCGWVHRDSLKAATVLLEELERSQLLQQLLRPGAASAGSLVQGLDCSGWQLVLSGHGLGAGVAALLAIRLQAWQLGPLSVWAYCPPGELCSGDLAAALGSACSLTAVLVGDDLAPRASSAAVRALVEQAIVGLARLRYSKTGLLVALIGEVLGPKRWHRRWVNPRRALRPLSEVPPEALAFLQRYRDWQQEQEQQQAGSLPGRVLLLSRLPAVAGAAEASGLADSGNGSSSASSAADDRPCQGWRAGWMGGGEVAQWGIRVSRHATSDHYVSRLLGVLGDLAAASSPSGTAGL